MHRCTIISQEENQLVQIQGLKWYQPPGKDDLLQVLRLLPTSKKGRKRKPGETFKENTK